MPSPASSTAILLFTRTPEEEVRHKRFVLHASQRANKELARRLIRQTERSVSSSGLPTYVITSRQQHGATFGERITAAFQEVFEKGFERVIAVGNDTLTLSRNDLLEASDLLESHTTVLGPTRNGGAYLIGIHRNAFHAPAFETLPWETDSLFSGLVSLLENAGYSIGYLAHKRDINTPADLVAEYKHLVRFSSLYRIIHHLLTGRRGYSHNPSIEYTTARLFPSISLRAPPVG